MIKHQVFEVTIKLGEGLFTWIRYVIGKPTAAKVTMILEAEIKEAEESGTPLLVDLYQRYLQLITDFGVPEDGPMEYQAYGVKIGCVSVHIHHEVIQC